MTEALVLSQKTEMGLINQDRVFNGRFNQLAAAVGILSKGVLPHAMEFPNDNPENYLDSQIEVEKKEFAAITAEFTKGSRGFACLVAKKGSVLAALAAMIFPKNENLADNLYRKMTALANISDTIYLNEDLIVSKIAEEEEVFGRLPVVSGENCLLAAALGRIAKEEYERGGNSIVHRLVKLIGAPDEPEGDWLTAVEQAWLEYPSFSTVLHALYYSDLQTPRQDNRFSLTGIRKAWGYYFPDTQENNRKYIDLLLSLGWTNREEHRFQFAKDDRTLNVYSNAIVANGLTIREFILLCRKLPLRFPAPEEMPTP